MNYNPTPTQALLLFGLLARHGECAQAELMPAVAKADREALEKEKLIGVQKRGRALYLNLEESGWDWASANLSSELPPPQGALHDMLRRLAEYLARSGETLAKFIGSKPPSMALTKAKPEKRSTSKPASASKGASRKAASKTLKPAGKPKNDAKGRTTSKGTKARAPSAAAVRKRIEAAYLSLTEGRKNETVRLSLLRAALAGLDRATVDAALGRILKGDKTASLMRHDDPNQLDQTDHDAAFSPTGEPFHVIWIAS